MSDPRYPPPTFPQSGPGQPLQPSYNYPFPTAGQGYPPPPAHGHSLPPLHASYQQPPPPPQHSLPPPPGHPHHQYAQHPLLAYPNNHPSQPHASSSSNGHPSGLPPREAGGGYYQSPYGSGYDQAHHQHQQQHYHHPQNGHGQHPPQHPYDSHPHHPQHGHPAHLPPPTGVQLPALHTTGSGSPDRKHQTLFPVRERLPSLTSTGEVRAAPPPSYASAPSMSIGMPVGGPPEGASAFAGRLPPKAKKTRKKSEDEEAALDGRDGADGEGAGDEFDASGKRRKRQRAGPGGDSLTCHQCRGYYESGLRCSRIKSNAKGHSKQCILVYCDRDVVTRYGVDPDAVRNGGPPTEDEVATRQHSGEAKYRWACPSCENTCQCSVCRKRNGLEPVDNLSMKIPAKTRGRPAREPGLAGAKATGRNRGGRPSAADAAARSATPVIVEDLSHLSAEERQKYIKERDRKHKLVLAAHERLEKLRADVADVDVDEVGFVFEEDRQDWEVDGDEGIAGRVELREFFWRFRAMVPLPEKLFTALDNFDKPIPDSTAKRMAVSMVDCLHAQVLKGSPSVGETPEAIEAERLVSKQIEELLSDVKLVLKPTTSALHLRKTLRGLLQSLEAAQSPPVSREASVVYEDEELVEEEELPEPTPMDEDAAADVKVEPKIDELALPNGSETAPDTSQTTPAVEAAASEPAPEELATSTSTPAPASVKPVSVASSAAKPSPVKGGKGKSKSRPSAARSVSVDVKPIDDEDEAPLPTTMTLLLHLSHEVLKSPDARLDMEDGLAQRAEMIKLQGREVKAFLEGRGKKRLQLEAELAAATGDEKVAKAAQIEDLPREDYTEHLKLVTSQRLLLHAVAGRSAAVLGVDAEDRIYVSLAPDWEGRKSTGWGVGLHVYGKSFEGVWPAAPEENEEVDDTAPEPSSADGANGGAAPPVDADGTEVAAKAEPSADHLSLSPASSSDILPSLPPPTTTTSTTDPAPTTTATTSTPTPSAPSHWHHFPTSTSIRALLDVVALQSLSLALTRGDLILSQHLPTSTSPSQRTYPEDAWYHADTNMGEYAEEGKVRELMRRMGEVADGREGEEGREEEEERKEVEREEEEERRRKGKSGSGVGDGVVEGKRKRVSRP